MEKLNFKRACLLRFLHKFIYDLLLLLALLVFGYLYFKGDTYKDLWVNLLASLLVIFVINYLVRRSESQKSQRSIEHAKILICYVCEDLMMRLRPPLNWRERVNADDSWKDYLARVISSRKLEENVETIIDRYHFLLERDLLNDLSDIVFAMKHFDWSLISSKERQFHVHRMIAATVNSSSAVGKALDIVKKYSLLKARALKQYGDKPNDRALKEDLEPFFCHYERIKEDSIQFRDAMIEKLKATENPSK